MILPVRGATTATSDVIVIRSMLHVGTYKGLIMSGEIVRNAFVLVFFHFEPVLKVLSEQFQNK